MLAELLQEASVVRAFAEIEAHHEDLVQLIIRLCENPLAHLCGGTARTGRG